MQNPCVLACENFQTKTYGEIVEISPDLCDPMDFFLRTKIASIVPDSLVDENWSEESILMSLESEERFQDFHSLDWTLLNLLPKSGSLSKIDTFTNLNLCYFA